MSVEPIEQVVKLWSSSQITREQAIGKILLWLQKLHRRMLQLEARLSGPNQSR